MIKFKTVSTRFKDIADLYYLSDKVNTAKLRECVDTYILSDTELPQYNNVDDILKVLNVIASNKKYKKRVISSKQLWIDDDIDEMFSVIIHALEKFNFFANYLSKIPAYYLQLIHLNAIQKYSIINT